MQTAPRSTIETPVSDPALIGSMPSLRSAIAAEWEQWGYFPCDLAIQVRGDGHFTKADLWEYRRSSVSSSMKTATNVFWLFRWLRILNLRRKRGKAERLPRRGARTLQFHTFFTDPFFYEAIRTILRDPDLNVVERQRWSRILVDLVATAAKTNLEFTRGGGQFRVYPFFPEQEARLGRSFGARFLRLSGIARVYPDADDTFVVLAMFEDFLEVTAGDVLDGVDDATKTALSKILMGILNRPYWKLARYYQFTPDVLPQLNFVEVEPVGGVSTWFGVGPAEAPDLVVNLNVLRSLLVSRARFGTLTSPDARAVVHRLLEFLWRNVSSGAFRRDRGYVYYLPEMFCLMFARLFYIYRSMSASEQQLADPNRRLPGIRESVLRLLDEEMSVERDLNAMDAAIAIVTARLLVTPMNHSTTWLRVLGKELRRTHPHFDSFEIFKQRIPTRMIYGSGALTTALAYEAIAT